MHDADRQEANRDLDAAGETISDIFSSVNAGRLRRVEGIERETARGSRAVM